MDARKDKYRDQAANNNFWLTASQGTVVFLGALVTVLISLNKIAFGRAPNPLPDPDPRLTINTRRWAIIPSALVTVVSGMAAFYNFGQSQKDNIEAQTEFALMLDEAQVSLIMAVGNDKTEMIDDDWLAELEKSLSENVVKRKEALTKLLGDRNELLSDKGQAGTATEDPP